MRAQGFQRVLGPAISGEWTEDGFLAFVLFIFK